jgi:hypothetical protein
MVDVTFALSIVSMFVGAIVLASERHFAFIAYSLDAAAAERAAAARLEALAAGAAPISAGRRDVPLPVSPGALPGGRCEEEVREVEPGLFQVEVAVSWPGRGAEGERRIRLATLVAREEGR